MGLPIPIAVFFQFPIETDFTMRAMADPVRQAPGAAGAQRCGESLAARGTDDTGCDECHHDDTCDGRDKDHGAGEQLTPPV